MENYSQTILKEEQIFVTILFMHTSIIIMVMMMMMMMMMMMIILLFYSGKGTFWVIRWQVPKDCRKFPISVCWRKG